MSQGQRFGLLGIGLVLIVGVFFVLRPEPKSTADEKKTDTTQQAQSTQPQTAQPQTSEQQQTATDAPKKDKGEAVKQQQKDIPLLFDGKIEKIKVKQGEKVHFQVISKKPEEVHVHGYDIAKDLPANKKVDVEFKATLAGKWEIELEGAGKQLAELTVTP